MLYTFSPFEFFFFLSVTFVLFSSFQRIDLFIVHIVSRSHLKLTYIQTIPNKPLCIGYLLSLAQVLYNNKFWAPIFRWTSPFEPTQYIYDVYVVMSCFIVWKQKYTAHPILSEFIWYTRHLTLYCLFAREMKYRRVNFQKRKETKTYIGYAFLWAL